MSDSLMMRKSSPSIWISVPAYLPYRTVSPIFTVTGSSFLPGPAATTVPRCGFSFAVSGMIMPPAVFSSAGAGFTITLSASGVTFNLLLAIVVFIYCFDEMDPAEWQVCKGKRIPYQTGLNVNISVVHRLFVRYGKGSDAKWALSGPFCHD